MIDVQEKKRKIISFLEEKGPSLPIQISKAIQMETIFTSAILSELVGAKEIKLSQMKVGSSPLYLLPGHEEKLETQSGYLKSAEKEAYLKLKQKKIIIDDDEPPAIRVALRNIKDFAIPFKFQERIMWRYAFTPEEDIQKMVFAPERESKKTHERNEDENIPKTWEIKKQENKHTKEESKKTVSISKKEEKSEPKLNKSKTFLKEIEEFLDENGSKIISIQEVDKKKVIAKIQTNEQNALLFAFNKKKITEDELIKCYKEAKSTNLPYNIIITGELTKKMSETIGAYKKLNKIDKININ